ncbi:MAG: hypothetical protein IJ193_07100 [Bacilli bacterium]|nr:hypothetical protein [Bacilli bacterium]
MVNTRAMFAQIMDEIDSKEEDYFEEANALDDKKALDEYLTTLDENVHDIYSLIDYANHIKSNMERILFERFCFFVFGNEEDTNTFFRELKNLSMLKRTGLMKYSNDQELYSRQIMSNFLLRLDQFRIDVREKSIPVEMYELEQSRNRLNKYKSYFSPIGIVHEVEDANDFNCFLEELDIPKKDKFELLLMAFEFNQMSHDAELKKYLPDLQEAKDVTIHRSFLPKEVITQISSISDITPYLKKKEEYDYITKREDEKEDFSFVDFNEDSEKLFEEANENLKENAKEDPYVLFNDYYDILLGKKEKESKKEKKDASIITKAQQYYDQNKYLVENLNDIAREDLEQTIHIFERDPDLRDEVYKTTQYIDRLLAYEIKKIFESIDSKDPENTNLLIDKLKAPMEYVEQNEKKSNKK